jgi:pimeloyl-ACP methyl ester carboxylesterase
MKREEHSMGTVISKDGTKIAYDRVGEGPPVILVTGALGVRNHPILSGMEGLHEPLAKYFTVISYDRRGRGNSGDTEPYAVEREIEDIEALIDEAGGSAALYGLSSGAALALEAANKLPTKVKKLVLYEPPFSVEFSVDETNPGLPKDAAQQVSRMVAKGRPGDAVAYFIMATGAPEEAIPQIREMPMWADMEKVAHTLAYDFTILGENSWGKPLRPHQWDSATMPTLVLVGGESDPFFHSGTQALVDNLPDARHRVLEGQGHEVSAGALAPVLVEFFKD